MFYTLAFSAYNMHQEVGVAMPISEFYLPLSYITKANRNQLYHILQMTRDESQDYMNSAELIRFQTVPYLEVHQIRFSRNSISKIQIKISHGDR